MIHRNVGQGNLLLPLTHMPCKLPRSVGHCAAACAHACIWNAGKYIGGGFKVPFVFKVTLCLHPDSGCWFAPCPVSGGFWQGGFPPDRSGKGERFDLLPLPEFMITNPFIFLPHCLSVIRPLSEQTRWTSTEEEKCPSGGDSGGLWRGLRLQRSKCVCVCVRVSEINKITHNLTSLH